MVDHDNDVRVIAAELTAGEEAPPVEHSPVDRTGQQNKLMTSTSESIPAVGDLVKRLARNIAEKATGSIEENVDKITRILKDVKTEFLTGLRSAPQSIAASDLASSQQMWLDWANTVNLVLFPWCGNDVLSQVAGIAGRVRYPEELQSLKLPNVRYRTLFTSTVREWASTLPSAQTEPATGQRPLSEALFYTWSRTKNAVDSTSGNIQAAQRVLADAVISLIFSDVDEAAPDEDRYEVFVEKDLALPRPQSDQGAAKVPVSARADTVVMKIFPDTVARDVYEGFVEVGAFNKSYLAHCLLQSSVIMYLGVFPVEAKRRRIEDAQRHVAMDLCSIQYQRRALTLKHRPVYGATIVNGCFKLYASVWDKTYVRVMPVGEYSWNLANPTEFIQCLYFMCSLKTHIDAGISEDFESFDREEFVAHRLEDWRYRPDYQSSKRRKEPRSDKKKRRLNDDEVEEGADVDVDVDASSEASDDDSTDSMPSPPRNMEPFNFLKTLEFAMEQNRKRAACIAGWQSEIPQRSSEDVQIYDDDG